MGGWTQKCFSHLRPTGESVAGLLPLWLPLRPHGLAWLLLCGIWAWPSSISFFRTSVQGCCWDPVFTSPSAI